MWRRGVSFVVFAAWVVLSSSGAQAQHSIEDRWSNPDYEHRKFAKIVVVGISANAEVRRNFENKFVSFLRGKDVIGVPGYSLAPNLVDPPSRDAILVQIEEQGIEAALSVRVVPLDKKTGEATWAVSWSAG